MFAIVSYNDDVAWFLRYYVVKNRLPVEFLRLSHNYIGL